MSRQPGRREFARLGRRRAQSAGAEAFFPPDPISSKKNGSRVTYTALDRMNHETWFHNERLHRAAAAGDLLLVKQLLADGCDANAFDDGLSRTPLHYAAEGECFVVATHLLASGADVNAHDEDRIGETPLGHVAATCSYEMAELLLEAGANPTILGWMQITALARAARRKKPEGVKVYELMLTYTRRKFGWHAV